MNIMTPEHEYWKEFCNKLAIGIVCKGGTNKDNAKYLLQDYDVDIEASLKYFEDHGGYCDCEILMNVDPEKI